MAILTKAIDRCCALALSREGQVSVGADLERFPFGNSPSLADELAALVLAGIKTATCWAVHDGTAKYGGKRMVVLGVLTQPLALRA